MRVNLDDELYNDGERTSDDEASCSEEEFELMVARLAREKIPNSEEPFEATLDSFLTLLFVPTFRACLKKRGVTVPLADAVVDSTVGE